MDDVSLRKQLVDQLRGEHAHVTAERAIEGLEPRFRCARPAPGLHAVWELVEHMRIAQQDILRYTLDPAWRSPEFPAGYWPAATETVSDADWKRSVSGFKADLQEVCALARDPARDLTARIPHGEWRTYLRQVLLVADHNAYHAGQVVLARRLLGAWPG